VANLSVRISWCWVLISTMTPNIVAGIFLVFLNNQIPGDLPQLGHQHFFLNFFQFINHPTIPCNAACNTERVLELPSRIFRERAKRKLRGGIERHYIGGGVKKTISSVLKAVPTSPSGRGNCRTFLSVYLNI
jgi:hypothetical protein